MKFVSPSLGEVKIHGVQSDHDGVIGETEGPSKLAWAAIIRFYGSLNCDPQLRLNCEAMKKVTPSDLVVFNGRNAAGRRQICLEMFGEDFPFDQVYAARSAALAAYQENPGIALCPGAREFIEFAAQRVMCSVVTSSTFERIDHLLRNNGLRHHFQVLIGGDKTIFNDQEIKLEQGKPDPEPYLLGAKLLGVQPEQCLAIEDSSAGVESAHRAGCITVMIPNMVMPTEQDREFATGGIYKSMTELLSDLKEWNR